MKISFRFVIPCLKRLTFQRHGIYKDFYRFPTRFAGPASQRGESSRVKSGMTLLIVAGLLLSGCIHRNQQAWSDQRESGNAPPSQPSVTPEPTATPTPTLQEFIEQKMKELDEIDEELRQIDQILRLHLDETE